MKNVILFICFLFLNSISSFAQKDSLNEMNQLNSKGQKEGYWVEKSEYDTIELYYKKGKKSGLFKSYSKKGTLSAFGEYAENIITGIWYYFGNEGHLDMIQKDFKTNTDIVLLDNGEKYLYPYKCYTILYYPNGKIKREGVLLWDEDPELDTVHEFGEWKYYNEEGKFIRIENFK